MSRFVPGLTALAFVAFAAPALAQRVPPSDALPLSRIIAAVEAMPDVARVTEADWDSDGYWEIEFIDGSNVRREVRMDPRTGAELPRRRR